MWFFKTLVVDLLNKYLGAYVENLDKNQLNVGLLGGDVKLTNLVLKQAALDSLDLPVQTVYGRIGLLVLKIPWTDFFNSPVVINIEDVYLLAQPNAQVEYDPVKEEKKSYDTKLKEIQKVEDAKKAAAVKDQTPTDFTLVERMITAVIRNIDLNIANVHIRYGDSVTNPGHPFALGVTLSYLHVISTDDEWKPHIVSEKAATMKIFKVVDLKGLAFYWNCNITPYGKLPRPELVQRLRDEIAREGRIPTGYSYILGPINAVCQLIINQKPELDRPAYHLPKIDLNLTMEKLFIGVSKAQYRDIIALADSMDRMTKGIPYRKYRPHVTSYRGHYAKWWHFAYTCIVEEQIKRRKQNWDWNHIANHRATCKEYGELYQKQLKSKIKGPELERLQFCEKKIDLINIVIIRQRIQFETERLAKTAEKQGWFGWMWGSNANSEDLSKSTDILKQFEKGMTPEEKNRLYTAIGYQENSAPAIYPEDFVDTCCRFVLQTLEVELRDDAIGVKRVLYTELTGVMCRLDTRTAGSAIKVDVKIDNLSTHGLKQDDFVPSIISSEIQKGRRALLEVSFETNPLDKKCDQRVHVNAEPITIVFDSATINKVVDIFKIPPHSSLDQISAAAGSTISDVRERTTTGLQHAIDTHSRLDLKVDFKAPYIIIPYGGKYTGSENVLVANLGNLKIHTIDRNATEVMNVRKLHAEGFEKEEILKEMISQSYDQFKLELSNLQIIMAQSDEDWKTISMESTVSDIHILRPVSLSLTYSKCLITDDPRLPLSKISAKLPSVSFNFSDARLFLLVALGSSIPLPETQSEIPEPQPLTSDKRTSSMMLRYLEMQDAAKTTKVKLPPQTSSTLVQFTTVDVNFIMSELSVTITHQEDINSPKMDLACFKVNSLECDLIQQTYNTRVSVTLSSISLKQTRQSGTIDIISTILNENEECLFKVVFTQVDIKSPELHSIYKSCETRLVLDFGKLKILLHQEGLLSLIQFSSDVQEQLQKFTEKATSSTNAFSSSMNLRRQISSISETTLAVAKPIKKKQAKQVQVVVETVKFKLNAKLQELLVEFATDESRICTVAVRGITTDIMIKEPYTQVNAKLLGIAIIDLNPITNYSLILSGEGGEALTAQVVINNLQEESNTTPDLVVELKVGGLRIVFLNWFVSRMLNFLNQFQAAQQTIINASQAAAQTAKDNMKDAYAKATKISLDIKLKAPDILVPVDSKSDMALFLDLGFISLSNGFLILDIKHADGFNAVLDELKMSLTHLKIARVKLNKKLEVEQECALLEPVDMKLSIKRNLSTSWYKEVPDVDISGKIKMINLHLSQADYQMVMNVLSGNLAEGQTESVKPVQELEETPAGPTSSSAGLRTISEIEISSPEVHVLLKFTFTMEQLLVNLYSGGTKNLDTLVRLENSHLARFSLEGLSLKGRILSDNSLITSVLLVNCLLDDMRSGRDNKLNRLIERAQRGSAQAPDSESYSRSMIDVTFQQKSENMFADVRVYSFNLILSMDFLMKVAEVFKVEDQATEHAKPSTKVTQTAKSQTQIRKPLEDPTPKNTQMTLNLKVEKPDIILVEHMDHINTNAMILNSEVVVKLRTSGPHQVISGSVKDIQLYTCTYNPEKRAETRSDVLHPVTISLAGSTPDDKGLHLELLVTDVRLRVSPTTIELLNKVLSTMSGGGVAQTEEESGDIKPLNIWGSKPFNDTDYWFLKTDVAEEAVEQITSALSVNAKKPLQEMCIISFPSVVVTIEAGVGNKTLPMIQLETSVKGTARNWSSQMSVEASLTLQMGYYNSRIAMWEPLIEPVEVVNDAKPYFTPWKLNLELTMNDQDEVSNPTSPVTPSTSDQAEIINQAPVMSIDITSDNNLELTVTKTCLEVLQNLGKAFASAIKEQVVKPSGVISPYKVLNEVGLTITLLLEESSFKVYGQNESVNEVILENEAVVPLQLKPKHVGAGMVRLVNELATNSSKEEYTLNIRVNELNCDLTLPVVRADKRFFMLHCRNDVLGVISDVKVDGGITVITLRSILQVYNHFNVPIEVYYMTPKDNELQSVATIEPGASLNVPLKAVYTPTNELFFAVADYSVTTTPYVWKDLQTNLNVAKLLQCKPKSELNMRPFTIKAIGEMEQVYYESTLRHTMASTCYNIHLRPPVIMKNCLPIEFICCIEELMDEMTIQPGGTLHLPNVEPGLTNIVIRIPQYLEKEWSCRQEIQSCPEEFAVWTFYSYDSPAKMALDLGMHTQTKDGSITMMLYCPLWMLNKTGLMLGYRSSDENLNVLHHPPDFKGPILFSFNAKNFFGKKRASIRVDQGDWSDKFSLDVAGSSGFVVCKANDRKYQIGVRNQLTYNGLTKQITFTPYYVIINNAPFPIECQEQDRPADAWMTIEAKSCSALWPKSELEDKMLKIRIGGTEQISAPFLYTESHTTLLKFNNKYAGINVDIQLNEGAVFINLAAYDTGMAPALIVNHTNQIVKFWEKESVQVRELKPKHCMLYTWENPSGPRKLVWEKSPKKEIENDLRKDGLGELSIAEDEDMFWASFLDGMQRVLLFTEDNSIAEGAQASHLFEIIQQEITVSIHGMGLSLVNNVHRQEIMYIGIASSGVIWETSKLNSNRYKQLSTKDSQHIETAYQQFMWKGDIDDDESSRIVVDNKNEVDFKNLLMYKPHKKKIRRTFQTGLWMQMKTSPNQMQLHAKVNRLQIDNQMYDCIFPVVLAPVPPPKSVAASSGIKPFVEVSIVQLLIKNSQIRQFKYFKMLVQEFHIKVDMGFINGLVALFENDYSVEDEKQLFLTDMKLVDEALYSLVSTQSLQEQKSFYDLLHFSPLKIHISFSMAGGTAAGQNPTTPNFLNVLLQGLGVTLTDLQDVVFKLAYFERDYTFLTQRQLISEATVHYVGQSIKQLYVLVLGLDVLGNPYGLVLGITKGVEDLFYEPFQGAIQGPGEFAEGLVLGFRSLFGHTVGGAAGAVSRITGAMGKGIAALTFDDDYQRKRREEMNKRPANIHEGFTRGGKGLVMGVVDGVTGVFTKPVSGAREQGVEGFFKGLGKGAVGLVARPAAGVIDFASGSFGAVKRAAEVGEDTLRLRAPRFLPADGLVRPFIKKEADGHQLLMELSKGKYATTDIYVLHETIIENKEVLLLTDKRIAYVTHNDIFGGWQMDWSYTWQELTHPCRVTHKGIMITTSEKKKKLFGSSDTTKTVIITDVNKREEVCAKIESLRGSL